MSMIDKQFIEKLSLKGRRILTRVDFNVPLNEKLKITDNGRITCALPTISHIVEEGGKAVLMSHLGRPGGVRVDSMSLKPAAEELSRLIGQKVILAPDCLGEDVEKIVDNMQNGEVVLLENLRFHKEEIENDSEFCKKLGKLGDVYINDAFGTVHRAHASTAGVTEFFTERAIGYLIRKELQFLGAAISKPIKPFATILGGAKVSDKIKVIERLLDKVQILIIGGGMACTFLKAQGYKIGASLMEEDSIDYANELIKKAQDKRVELLLPIDTVIADRLDKNAETHVVTTEEGTPEGWLILDIGPQSTEIFREAICRSRTILWNGPMGVFEMEAFAKGTFKIAQSLVEASNKGAVTIVGGGDSASAVQQSGLCDSITHVSTGGGASLEFLEGKELPGVSAIQQSI